MTRKEEKQLLRQTMRRLEQELSIRYKETSDRAIAAHLLALPEYRAAQTVFCFVGTNREINTLPILEDALSAGKTLCTPLCVDDGIMELRRIDALSQLSVTGAFGILEPAADTPVVSIDAVDFAVIPCMTCSRFGQRLGKGGGYYDRFLSHYRGGMVMLCREKLLRQEIPLEPHDYPIPWVLTERCLYEDGFPAGLF